MSLSAFVAAAGEWRGQSSLQDPSNGIAEQCASTAQVTPVLHDRFVRVDYTWSYHDKPQEGSLLMAHDPGGTACELYWIDTWHMGHVVMSLRGDVAGPALTALGSYSAPSGPDWGWRIDLACTAADLTLTMYNITPEGQQELAVRAVYTRV